MTQFDSVYDEVLSLVATALPSHTRITNPYVLEQNAKGLMRQGYGLAIGSGINSNRNLCPKVTIARELVVVITRQYIARELDASTKASSEKALIDDQLLVVKELCDNTDLSGTLGNVNFISDGGIEHIFLGNMDNFLALQTTFSVEVFEDV